MMMVFIDDNGFCVDREGLPVLHGDDLDWHNLKTGTERGSWNYSEFEHWDVIDCEWIDRKTGWFFTVWNDLNGETEQPT